VVPRDITNHVMLTAFVPGDRQDVVIPNLVSLVDIAPTLAARLGIEMPLADGIPLPLDGRSWIARRSPVDLSPQLNPVEDLDTWRLSADSIRNALTFRDDGTYRIDPSELTTVATASHGRKRDGMQ
jgi:arylsulfatase A-like enzyme